MKLNIVTHPNSTVQQLDRVVESNFEATRFIDEQFLAKLGKLFINGGTVKITSNNISHVFEVPKSTTEIVNNTDDI